MKRSTLSKLALTLVAAFVFVGANAQTNTGSTQWGDAAQAEVGDFTRSNATPWNTIVDVTYGDRVTSGATIPFWVWPSAAYNANWNYVTIDAAYADPADIVANVASSFAWKYVAFNTDAATTLTDVTAAGAVAGFAKNYVEIGVGTTLGNKVVQVIETPASAFACAADPVYFGFEVIDEPMVKYNETVNTRLGIANVMAIGCEGATDVLAAATAIDVAYDNGKEIAAADNQNARYHVNLTYNVYNYDIDGATGNLINQSAALAFAGLTNKVFGQDGAAAPSAENPIFASSTSLVVGQNYVVENSKATVYEFALTGWNAGISRKSDYKKFRDNNYTYAANLDQFTYYTRNSDAAAITTVRIVVLPKPVTGPIFHIANNYAY